MSVDPTLPSFREPKTALFRKREEEEEKPHDFTFSWIQRVQRRKITRKTILDAHAIERGGNSREKYYSSLWALFSFGSGEISLHLAGRSAIFSRHFSVKSLFQPCALKAESHQYLRSFFSNIPLTDLRIFLLSLSPLWPHRSRVCRSWWSRSFDRLSLQAKI